MRKKLRQRFAYETLESKCLLAADIYISEFMAINNTGIVDEDGDDSDWIELYNAGPDDAQLSDYFLTDKADRLAKWRLPEKTLSAGNHLLIYASGKDRTDPGQPFHANFKLSGSGEYLALTQRDPDNQNRLTVVSEFSPEFGQQFGDISYGVGQDVEITPLVENSAEAKVFYPADDSLGDSWMSTDFDDSTWADGSLSVGYQRTQPGLLVEDVKAVGQIKNLTEALAVLDGDGQASRSFAVLPNINFRDTEGGGGEEDIFDNDSPFPNNTDADDNDFVIRATGTITIPSPGIWGIGAVHDDGISIKIDGVTVHENDTLRPGGLGFGLVELEAGDHSIEVVYFERGGPAELELLAGQEGPSLVGDVSNGGLAIRTGSTVRGLAELIQTDTLDAMSEQGSSVYVRNRFAVDGDALPESLTLRTQYDGGFVA
ncbi:MAG: lamin tail domain-containing protein, partial [Planctomycetota bacterium]